MLENGGKSYRIRSEENRHSAGVRAGCQSCEGHTGGAGPWRGRWARGSPGGQRLQFGQAGTGSPSSLWKRPIFSPKRLPCGTGGVCSLSLAKAKPYPCAQCSAWVSQGCSWRLAPSPPTFPLPLSIFFHSFPPPLPPLPCALAEHPLPRLLPKRARRADYCHRSSAFALLPVLSAPPSPNRGCPGERGRAARAWPGRAPSRGWCE